MKSKASRQNQPMPCFFLKMFPASTAHEGRHSSTVVVSGQGSNDVSTCSGIRGAQPGTEVCCKAGAMPRGLPRAGIPGEILLRLFAELTLWKVAFGRKGRGCQLSVTVPCLSVRIHYTAVDYIGTVSNDGLVSVLVQLAGVCACARACLEAKLPS